MAGPMVNVPGVYLRDVSERTAPVLATGVPVFVGLVNGAQAGPLVEGPIKLMRKSDFRLDAAAHLAHAVTGFFDSGGTYCYVVGVRAGLQDNFAGQKLIEALSLTTTSSDVDLVAIPDAVALPLSNTGAATDTLDVQRALVRHCHEQGTRLALLDSLPNMSANAVIEDQLQQLGLSLGEPVNAAFYYPWIKTVATDDEFVPPCGHVAGLISRTDALSGVFRAPANLEIPGAIDVQSSPDNTALAQLNEKGVNCLRSFAARGIRIWGARTPSIDPMWRYLNVRRLVLTVLRWVDLNMRWVSFEPNVPALWARIQRELSVYLTTLWHAGALHGAAVDEAFFVRCNAELNPPDGRETGHVITEIGLAPTVPAEFIVISVQHRAGTTELI